MITGTIRLFFRLLFLPVRIAVSLFKGTLRLGFGTLRGSFRLGVGTGKATGKAASGIGFSRILFFGAGVGVGYLLGSPAARISLLRTLEGFNGGTPIGSQDATVPLPRP
jgi:hypothetical protein